MYKLVFCPLIPCLKRGDGIGPKVLNVTEFTEIIRDARLDSEGTWGLEANDDLQEILSSGLGLRTVDQNDYLIRPRKGRVGYYLKREFALPVFDCQISVVTKQNYVVEHDLLDAEHNLAHEWLAGATHVVRQIDIRTEIEAKNKDVARSVHDFVYGLATLDEARRQEPVGPFCDEAKKVNEFWRDHMVVAD